MAVHKATILPRGNTLGVVHLLPEEDTSSISVRELRAQIDVSMGGRVAEELVFGADAVTSGASQDLRVATAVARRMVMEYGMSDLVGPVAVSDRDASAQTKHVVNQEVTRMLRESQLRVRTLLEASMPELNALAKALLDNELLTADQIRDVVAKARSADDGPGGGSDAVVAGLAPAAASAAPATAVLPRSAS